MHTKIICIYFIFIISILLSGCGIKDSLNGIKLNTNVPIEVSQSEEMGTSQTVSEQTEKIELRAMQIAEFSEGEKYLLIYRRRI